MKEKLKFIALALVLIIGSVAILTGCMYALAEVPAEETEYDRSDFVDESLLISDEEPVAEPAESDEADEPAADDIGDIVTEVPTDEPAAPVDASNFSAQVSLYNYKTNNVALVEVKNLCEVNSMVTVTGSYLDENGDVIGTESKSFDGFEPGLVNNFIFNPGYAFADFTYAITAEVSEKVSHATEIDIHGWYGGWLQDTQDNWYPRPAYGNAWFGQEYDPVTYELDYNTGFIEITVDIVHANHSDKDVDVSYDFLVLDTNGDVYHVGEFERCMDPNTPPRMEDYASRPVGDPISPEEYLANATLGGYCPEELKNGFRIVIALTESGEHEEWDNTWYLSELLDFFVGELGYDYDYIVNWAFEEAEWRGIDLIVDVEL